LASIGVVKQYTRYEIATVTAGRFCTEPEIVTQE